MKGRKMKFASITTFLFAIVFGLSACNATSPSSPVAIATEASATDSAPDVLPTVLSSPDSAIDLGYDVLEPAALLDGFVFKSATVDGATRSVCQQYVYSKGDNSSDGNLKIFIVQGPIELAPELVSMRMSADTDEVFSASREDVVVGGAENSSITMGLQRKGWACNQAELFAADGFYNHLNWQMDGRQYELYTSLNMGCETPDGLTRLDLLRLAESMTGVSTHPADELDPDCLQSIADVETLAGFDVKEPSQLPEGISFHFATYNTFSTEPYKSTTLHFKYIHKLYGDKGHFFFIDQVPQTDAPVTATSCGQPAEDGCELLKLDGIPVVYRLYSAGTEELDWYFDGFSFTLFRSAGEPGKVYKDDLVKVVESMLK
jgi:hypothetical protein